MVDKEADKLKVDKITEFDFNKIVKKAQATYDKTENGLARQIATGSSLVRPQGDSDFIIWQKNDFWMSLTGLRGLPMGKLVQISGKENSGKSTLANQFMKYAQDQGCLVILWDAERKFSAPRFKDKIGGDPSKLLVVDANSIVDGAKAVAQLVHSAKEDYPNCKIMIAWDSIGASLATTETKEEDEDYSMQPGVASKEIGWAIKKFNKLANQYRNRQTGEETISILVVNQVYANIGSHGSIERGGSQLAYLSSLIIQMTRKQDLTRVKQGQKYRWGIASVARVKKNHLFDGQECIAAMDLMVSADGIHLATDVKSFDDLESADDEEAISADE